MTVLPTQKGDRSCSRSLAGPPSVCKPEVAPASVCSSYLRRKLSQGNGDCGCQVGPLQSHRWTCSGHAHICRYAVSWWCSKAESKVSRTRKRLKSGLQAHTAPERVLGTIRLLGTFQVHYRVKGLRRVQSDGPSQRVFPSGLLGWMALCPGDRHTAPLPQCSASTLRESKKARLSWLLPASVSLVSKEKEGRPTEQGKSPQGMNFN